MGIAAQVFDHDSPSAPTLSRGMILDTAGVKAPPLQTIGVMTGLSSANGSFSDILGKGQFDYDSSGYLYVCDTANNRVQKFVKNSTTGVWAYDSKCSSTDALGTNVTMEIVAIDRSRAQIHLASSAQNATSTWVGVWDLSLWPTLTVANRTRSYGTQSGSNGSGNARTCICLTLVGDIAYAASGAGDYRCLAWNHTTGALVAEDTNSLWQSRFASDGTQLYSGSQATNTELGLWLFSTSTLQGTARIDSGLPAGVLYTRRNELVQGAGGDIVDICYYSGRVYVRTIRGGEVMSWYTAGNTFCDEVLWPGGASPTASYGHSPGLMYSPQIQQAKIGVAVAASSALSDDFIMWSSNADNTATQSFLTVWPMTAATATWTKNDWSSSTNTLARIAIQGVNLSAEKCKVRISKNSGAWTTLTLADLASTSAVGAVGTFTGADVLTVELSLSMWDRLDGHASLVSTRDKLTPTNVALVLYYEDPAVYSVPTQAALAPGSSVGAQIIERALYVIEQTTPDMAPTACRPETDNPNGFIRHSDNTCRLHQVTDPGRLRLIEAVLENPRRGAFSSSTISASFEKLLRIRCGYPLEQYETINGTQFLIEDLKQSDAEQIDRLLTSGGFGNYIDATHGTISGVTLTRIEGEQSEFSGRVRSLLFGVQFERTY